MLAVCQRFGIQNPAVPAIATAFGGGIGGTGSVCGAFVGAVMAIGLREGRPDNSTRDPRPYQLTQELRRRFEQEMGHIECRTLTGMDLSTPEGVKAFYASGVLQRVCMRAVGTAHRAVVELLDT